MRTPILAVLITVIGFPLASLAQSPPPPTREEALASARRNLAKCEAIAAENPQLKFCGNCSRAVKETPTAKVFVFVALYKSCNEDVKNSEKQVRLAAEKKRQAEQQKAAQAAAAKSAASAAPAQAQAGAGPARAAKPATTEKVALRVDGAIDWSGYENARTMQAVMVGDFERYRRGSLQVRTFLQFYLDAFEATCGPFLPPDAVVIVRQTIEVTRRAGGFEQRNVVNSKRITMAPKFADGYQNYPTGGGAYAVMGGLGDRNAVKNVLTFLQAWSADIRQFFEVEACQGPTMRQMGENLARLTSGRASVQDESNAGQILAALRVRVPQAVEDADVRAKRARADAYWNKQRASWAQPPTIAGQGTGQLKINYAAIAPDYEIPIPTPEGRQRIDINVENSNGHRIRWIQLTPGTPPTAPADVPSQAWETFFKAQSALLEEGARVLNCTYDNFATLKTVAYWYRESPKSLDREAMKAAWPDSPLLQVRAPRTACPVVMP